jgi:hypothetical protein
MPGVQGNRFHGGQTAGGAGAQDLSGAVRKVRRQGVGQGRRLSCHARLFGNGGLRGAYDRTRVRVAGCVLRPSARRTVLLTKCQSIVRYAHCATWIKERRPWG